MHRHVALFKMSKTAYPFDFGDDYDEQITARQRAFRKHFRFARSDVEFARNAILSWLDSFKALK